MNINRKCVESSIIFHPFLYANVPAESPSYAPTFFSELKYERQRVHFLLTNFSLFYRYTHSAWKKKLYSLPRSVNLGAGSNVYGNVTKWGDPYHEFGFIYHWCGIYVRCKSCNMKVQTIQQISCNFREKIQNLSKNKYTGGQIK